MLSMVHPLDNQKHLIDVEVAYALPEQQFLVNLRVPLGTSAIQAVEQSGLLERFIGLDITNIGIFSQRLGSKGMASADVYVLEPFDRVEIYRHLSLDPKEIRRRRAEKSAQKTNTKSSL
jgi:putative ubiquitin-RnfH superfamily antitoxin RatB of RatAB toxin-antitoxin module